MVTIFKNDKSIIDNNPNLQFTNKEQMERYRNTRLRQTNVKSITFKYEER